MPIQYLDEDEQPVGGVQYLDRPMPVDVVDTTVDPQRLRLLAQGATFAGADEAEAGLRTGFGLVGDYGKTLEEIRADIAAARQAYPIQSLGLEMAGAIGPALAAAPFTGGGSIPATLGRVAATSAAQGAAYGFGAGEGGFTPRLMSSGAGAVVGGVTGPVAQKGFSFVANKGPALIDFTRRKLGNKASTVVEAEIQRIAQESGESVDDVIARVERGEIMADLNSTAQEALRAYRASSGEAQKAIDEVVKARPGRLRQKALDTVQGVLTDGDVDANVLKLFQSGQTAIKKATSEAYKKVFASGDNIGDEGAELVTDILNRDRTVANEVTRILKLEKMKPFFNVKKDGTITLLRKPSLEEAEVMRRALADKTTQSYKAGKGRAGEAYDALETQLRTALDEASPDLAATRARWASVKSAGEAFEQGQKAFNQGIGADAIEIAFNRLVEAGDDDAVRAFRMGLADAIRRKSRAGNSASLMKALTDEFRNEAQVFNAIFPADVLDDVMPLLTRAAGAQDTKNVVMGGSQTAKTLLEAQRIGSTPAVGDVAQAASGDVVAIGRLARQAVNSFGQRLNDSQKAQVAQLLVEENPEVLRKALTDEGGIMMVQRAVDNIIRRLTPAARAAGTVGAVSPTAQAVNPAAGLLSDALLSR